MPIGVSTQFAKKISIKIQSGLHTKSLVILVHFIFDYKCLFKYSSKPTSANKVDKSNKNTCSVYYRTLQSLNLL